MNEPASELLEALQHPPMVARRWVVGLSGGIDSTVLLHLALQACQRLNSPKNPELIALHINHGLSTSAQDWAAHCGRLAGELGVAYRSVEVAINSRAGGPEAAARRERYSAFEAFLQEDDLLLLAHHMDDQIETFFLKLMRGAGIDGLVGMPVTRILGAARLWRPLLETPRSDIEDFANSHGLSWIEDESNFNHLIDRNFIRGEVLPLLAARWPEYRKSVAASTSLLREQADLQRTLHDDRLNSMVSAGDRGEPMLPLSGLLDETQVTVAALVRRWLDRHKLQQPARAQLTEFLRQASDSDSASLQGSGFKIQCYRGCLYLLPTTSSRPDKDNRNQAAWGSNTVGWVGAGMPLARPESGCLSVNVEYGAGIRIPESGRLEVRYRAGGERCRPVGRAHSQSVKKLLQEYKVSPWWRQVLPLVFDGEHLVAAADIWVCESYQVAWDEPGWTLQWQPPSLPYCA